MQSIMPLIIALVVVFLALGILREVACWWIKTTQLVRLLQEIRDQLRIANGLEIDVEPVSQWHTHSPVEARE